MSHTLIVGNWKMNLGAGASRSLAAAIAKRATGLKQTSVWLAPSFTGIREVVSACQGSEIEVGGQNVHWEETGAFTGEISPAMLREAGCTFSIVGHSERRIEMGEPTERCARRAHGALAHGLKVVFCVGETLKERERNQTKEVLSSQLKPFLEALPAAHRSRATLAYEPVWAIGTGHSATSTEIEDTHAIIEAACRELLGGECMPILYGGSVTPENFSAVIHSKRVMGALIGSASLSAEKFIKMIELSEES